MSKEKDGGPAFPLPYEHTEVVTRMQQLREISTEQLLEYTKQLRGISVRDYFAAKAMAVVWTEIPENADREFALDRLGRYSYAMADAMLSARAQ